VREREGSGGVTGDSLSSPFTEEKTKNKKTEGGRLRQTHKSPKKENDDCLEVICILLEILEQKESPPEKHKNTVPPHFFRSRFIKAENWPEETCGSTIHA
jgi:hypothetical protein